MFSENLGYFSVSKLLTVRIIVYVLTNDDVSKLITEQNKPNFIKCQELIKELAKGIGNVQHPSFLRANDIHVPKFSGDPGEDVKHFSKQRRAQNLRRQHSSTKSL